MMKILVAGDEPITRRVLEANLVDWGYDVLAARDGREALDILRPPEAPGLVILDWIMPRLDGPSLCREIRRIDITGCIYVILLTAEGARDDVIEGLEAGADDFLTQPIDRDELRHRIRIGERVLGLERRILKLAGTDPLTGVLNRRAFLERMAWETDRSHRDKAPVSFILADLDRFETINDAHGHPSGDQVLQRFSEIMSQSIRTYDFMGRFGGEAFAACLPGAALDQAASIAERIRASTARAEISPAGAPEAIRITASFGVAAYTGHPLDRMDLFIKRADDALYRAKHEGRDRVRTARDNITPPSPHPKIP